MSSLHKQFKMNTVKEHDGVSVSPAGANEDGTVPTFVLARMGPMNKRYQKTLERVTQPFKRQLELQTIDPKKADELVMQVFVNSILMSWTDVQNEKGEAIAFNADNAIQLFVQLPDLYFELQKAAQNAALYRLDEIEESAKN